MTRSYFFKSFRRFYRFKCWLQPRVSAGGRLLIGALLAAGVFGVDIRKSLAFQVFAVALGLLVASVLGAVLTRGRFRFRRWLPRFATRGERFTYRAEISNLGKHRQAGLLVQEVPEVRVPWFEEFHRLREPGYARRNWFDRYMGYPRWTWVMRLRRGISAPEQPLPPLESGESAGLELELVAHRRGHVSFSGARVLCPEPLGILRRVVHVSAPGSVLVLPKMYPMPRFEIGQGRRKPTSGSVDRRSVGGADEFKGLREYRPGDGLRHIDWRASARHDEPMVKEFNRERRGGVTVFLDTEAELYGEPFEAAVSVAASVMGASPDPTELVLVRPAPPRPGAAQSSVSPAQRPGELVRAMGRERAMTVLASVQAGSLSIEVQANVVARALHPDAVVAVLNGFDAGRAELLELLHQRTGGEVAALVVLDGDDAPVLTPPPEVTVVRGISIERDLARFAEARSRLGRRVA